MHLDSTKRLVRLVAGMVAPALALIVMLSSSTAEAHFRLLYPPQWIQESDTLGDPQKAGPCGTDSTTPGTPTNDVTTFAPGQKITLHFIETISHDGWYRISLSYANRTDLTDPPYETNPPNCIAKPGLNCLSVDAGIESPVVPPVLADGVLKHSASMTVTPKDWTYDLTLPTQPCAKCTLQVEEIMLNHGVNQADGPFTYHHCADIAIVAGGDGGTTTKGADGGAVVVEIDSGVSSSGTGGAGTSSGTSSAGSSGAGNDASEGAGTGGDDGGTGTSSGDNSSGPSGGGSGGCDASGRGTTPTAGFALLFGGIAAGLRRRRRSRS
jgi:uncharacterized protein (TIGR03382 family)